MAVAIVPFSTGIMAEYILVPEYRNAAVTTYCIGYLLPIPAILIVVFYATQNNRLIDPRLSRKFIRMLYIKLFVGLAFAMVAIGFSFTYPLVSVSLLAIALISYLLPPDTPVYEGVPEGGKILKLT